MIYTATIDNEDRLVLPKKIRERFNLSNGSRVKIQEVGDHLEIRPLIEKGEIELIAMNGRLIIPALSDQPFDAAEEVIIDREERDSNYL